MRPYRASSAAACVFAGQGHFQVGEEWALVGAMLCNPVQGSSEGAMSKEEWPNSDSVALAEMPCKGWMVCYCLVGDLATALQLATATMLTGSWLLLVQANFRVLKRRSSGRAWPKAPRKQGSTTCEALQENQMLLQPICQEFRAVRLRFRPATPVLTGTCARPRSAARPPAGRICKHVALKLLETNHYD